MTAMQQLWDEHAAWSQATFGSDSERGPAGPVKHLASELAELTAAPDDLSEWADCLLLTMDAGRRAGYGCRDLCEAAFEVGRQYENGITLRTFAHIVGRANVAPGNRAYYPHLLCTLRWAADDCLLLWDDVVRAAIDKLAVNKARKWPVPTDPNAPVMHVK